MRDLIPPGKGMLPTTAAERAALEAEPHNSPEVTTPEHDGSPILPPDGLSPAQRIAVAALVCGKTFSSAAIQAGVDRSTLFKWRRQPAFAEAVESLSREALEATATRARNLLLKATRTLADSLDPATHSNRFGWACKLVNSRRLWDLAQTLPKREDGQ